MDIAWIETRIGRRPPVRAGANLDSIPPHARDIARPRRRNLAARLSLSLRTACPLLRNRRLGRVLGFALAAALVARALCATADDSDPSARLGSDYFVGASVFLFQRTVLIPFAPAGVSDGMLDAGVIVAAHDNAGDEDGAVALDAIVGWLAASGYGATGPAPDPMPALDQDRRRALVCLIFGAGAQTQAVLAHRAGLGEADREACTARYQDARKRWAAWLLPYRRATGMPSPLRATPGGAPPEGEPVLRLAFAPTVDETDQAIADAMRRNGLFQVLTDDLNTALIMPLPMTALLTQCGEAKAFYNPDRGEAVLCYEMLAALLKTAPE
jgi:Putative metallopeptidase